MMNHTAKNIFPWIIIICIFIFGYYLFSKQQPSRENSQLSSLDNSIDKKLDNQELALKQKLIDDFENAFLKQYTPLIGCEEFHIENQSKKCSQHLEKAKHDFKDEFIESRGLPKNTFEELELSQVE